MEKEKEGGKIKIRGEDKEGEFCHTRTFATPPVDKSNKINELENSAGVRSVANPPFGVANPPVDRWRAYQQDRVAHHLAHHPEDEARAVAWADLITRWCWVHRDGHPLAANDDQRDVAMQALLAMGLTPSSI
jgi:hypothetical protein